MRKIALFIGTCCVLIIVGRLGVHVETTDSPDVTDQLRQLNKQISPLDERIESTEKDLDDDSFMKLTAVRPDVLAFKVPGIIPRQQRLPTGPVLLEFEGIAFYGTPVKKNEK